MSHFLAPSSTTTTTPVPLTVMRSNKLYNAQHPPLMAPFTSNLDAPSGLLAGTCLLPPPPLLVYGVLEFQALQALSVCFLFLSFFPYGTLLEQPWCAALVTSVGVLTTFTSHLEAILICLMVENSRACLWFHFLLLSGECPFIFIFSIWSCCHRSLCI